MVKLNSGNAASGALSGAATGASLGSFIPGIGTALGAGLGGLLGGATGLFSGRNSRNVPTLDRNQRAIYQQYADAIQNQGPLASLFNFDSDQARNLFNQNFAQPAYQQFQDEIVPQLTGSFRGRNLGTSSYLGSALAKAGSNVQNNLNNNLSNILFQGQQNSLERRIRALQDILSMQTFAKQQRQPNAFESILGGLSSGTGQSLANMFFQPRSPSMAVNGANTAFNTGAF